MFRNVKGLEIVIFRLGPNIHTYSTNMGEKITNIGMLESSSESVDNGCNIFSRGWNITIKNLIDLRTSNRLPFTHSCMFVFCLYLPVWKINAKYGPGFIEIYWCSIGFCAGQQRRKIRRKSKVWLYILFPQLGNTDIFRSVLRVPFSIRLWE